MRKLTTSENITGASWLLLLAAAFMTSASSRIFNPFFRSVLEGEPLPNVTEFFLSSASWPYLVSLVFPLIAILFWKRDNADRNLQYLCCAMHFTTVVFMLITLFGIIVPFLGMDFLS